MSKHTRKETGRYDWQPCQSFVSPNVSTEKSNKTADERPAMKSLCCLSSRLVENGRSH